MISVCIATYNGECFIDQQLKSILKQIGNEDEVIVSDDGSTDGTLSIVRQLNDPRINIIKGPCSNSLIRNFEHALKAAKGDYIFLSDQDDIWNERKVQVCMDYLQRYDCIVSDAVVVDSDLRVKCPSFYKLNKTKTGRLYNLIAKNGYLGCCMAFRRSVLTVAIPFPKNIPMHDIWIGNVAAFKFSVKFIPERLILFRRHNHNISTSARCSRYPIGKRLMFRINMIKALFKLQH